MKCTARLKQSRISPQKCRIVADQIRGMPVEKALEILKYNKNKSSVFVKKVLESAIANAEHNQGADIDELNVSAIWVDEGPVMKRFKPRAKGRINHIYKRTSHITVIVEDRE